MHLSWIALVALLASPPAAPPHSARTGQDQPAQAKKEEKKPRKVEASDLAAYTFRSIGPANMGGRVADIAHAPGDAKTYFVAYGCGGVFKTTNRGVTFKPIFEHEKTSSVGSIAVADAPAEWSGWKDENVDLSDRAKAGKAKIVWVGTGEGNGRNSSSWGAGVYRSIDGGDSFKQVGLEDSRDIPSLAIDPRDPDTCYVAALGALWGPNKTRGVYKTSDGGKTWKQLLFLNEDTGAIQVGINPKNPDVVYAALYQRRRSPFSFISGGKEGGIYRSKDAGKTWTKLTNGLPAQTGRIGFDIFQADPNELIATIESDQGGAQNIDEPRSKSGGVFRSSDGGDTWKRINVMTPRAFYFSKIKFGLKSTKRVYMLGYDTFVSDDGGANFRSEFTPGIHGDCHAMLIDPADPDHVIIGDDGGLYESNDDGKTWQHLDTMATGQFYNIAVDQSTPYNVMGGLQDNQSWIGPSRTYTSGAGIGITNQHWEPLPGGDGFHVAFDPVDPTIVYAESQGGELLRMERATNKIISIKPLTKEGDHAVRYNWNTPFLVSSHDPKVLYLGGNYVFKLLDRGDRWERISPDLTTRDPNKMDTTGSTAENHCTVVSLTESPLAKGLLWTGSDDGLIYVTTDEGAHWENVTPKTVNGQYIADMQASAHAKDRCYAVVDAHRTNDYDPKILVTDDLGKTWKEITANLPKGEGSRSICEDPANPDVLYAGTETSVYVSVDRGGSWLKMGGIPTCGMHDLLIHPRERDLVVGTHGRSIWICDDTSAIARLTSKVIESDFTVFPIQPDAPRLLRYVDWSPTKNFAGQNPRPGMKIDYWLKDKGAPVTFKVEDADGVEIARFSGSGNAGMNRAYWTMDLAAKFRLPNQGQEGLYFVKPGKYKLTATSGKMKQITEITVLPHPYEAKL